MTMPDRGLEEGRGERSEGDSDSHPAGDERLADGENRVTGGLDPLACELGLLRQVDGGGDGRVAPALLHHVLRCHLSPPGPLAPPRRGLRTPSRNGVLAAATTTSVRARVCGEEREGDGGIEQRGEHERNELMLERKAEQARYGHPFHFHWCHASDNTGPPPNARVAGNWVS
jgi:hypothetical protein